LISIEKWKGLYKDWTGRTGRFSHLPPLSKPNASAFAPLEETVLQVKAERPSQTSRQGRLSKSDLEAIFAKETWRLSKTCHNNINTLVELIAHKVGLINSTVGLGLHLWNSMEYLLSGRGATTIRNGVMDAVDGPKDVGCSKESL